MRKKLLALFVVTIHLVSNAQTPQWNWAKGVGGNHQENLLGTNNTLQVDSLGNSYEIITSQSSSINIGGTVYPNPIGTGTGVAYFVKYSSLGSVVWVKSFPQYPAAIGGGPNIPQGFFTNQQGDSYILLNFFDSLSLGGITLIDTTIHFSATSNPGYCIAKYDANGNVISLHAHKSRHSGIYSIRKFNGNQMLGFGQVVQPQGDTLNGHAVPFGYFISVLDSFGNVQIIKSIGYDSLGVEFLTNTCIAVSNNSVYVNLSQLYHPIIDQANIPIGSMTPYSDPLYQQAGKNLLFKFDSLLNFQWFIPTSKNIGSIYYPLTADKNDNVYLTAYGQSISSVDTLKIDTNKVALPFVPPFGVNLYVCIVKINGNGNLQWVNKNIESGSACQISSLNIDQFDNVYVFGKYQSYLIAGNDTLSDPSNLFVLKISKTNLNDWAISTSNGIRCIPFGITEDGHGNIFLNGQYADPNYPVHFGSDSLICHTPIANYPLAADIFNARLGNCNMAIPTVANSSSLNWCGADSVLLTASLALNYLWNTGDTTQNIIVHASGNFHVFCFDSLGCYAQSAMVTTTVNQLPSATVTPNDTTTICFGESVTLNANTGTGLNYQWQIDSSYVSGATATNYVASTSGNYSVVVTNSSLCSASSYLTTVIVNPIPNTGVTQIATTLTAQQTVATYQWINCDNLSAINGATNQTFTATSNGNYAVVVTTNICSDTSACFLINSIGIDEINFQNNIVVKPNPAHDKIQISILKPAGIKIKAVTVNNLIGEVIIGQNQIDKPINISALSSGVYFITIETNEVFIHLNLLSNNFTRRFCLSKTKQ